MNRRFLLKFIYVERSYQESHYDKFLFELEDDYINKRIDAYQFLIRNNPRTTNDSLVRIMFLLPKDPDLPDGYDTSTYSLSLRIHNSKSSGFSMNRLQLQVSTNEKEYQPLLDIYNNIDEFRYLSDMAEELMRFLSDVRYIIDGFNAPRSTNFSSSDNWIDIENFRIYISTTHTHNGSPLLIMNECTRVGVSKYELNLNYNWKIFVRDPE